MILLYQLRHIEVFSISPPKQDAFDKKGLQIYEL